MALGRLVGPLYIAMVDHRSMILDGWMFRVRDRFFKEKTHHSWLSNWLTKFQGKKTLLVPSRKLTWPWNILPFDVGNTSSNGQLLIAILVSRSVLGESSQLESGQ